MKKKYNTGKAKSPQKLEKRSGSSSKKRGQVLDQASKNVNILSVLSRVRSHVALHEEDEKVQAYKSILEEDLKNKADEALKKRGRFKKKEQLRSEGQEPQDA